MEKIQETGVNKHVPMFSYKKYIEARLLVYFPFSAHCYPPLASSPAPPLHHNGKGSIEGTLHGLTPYTMSVYVY